MMFPVVIDLRTKRVVVIGAGKIGVHKMRQLIEAGAYVVAISDEVLAPLPEGLGEFHQRRYQYGDLEGAFMVVTATGDPEVNDGIVAEANENNILLNSVDDLARCNFYFTAVHRDGDLLVSVSTEGASPALAQWVRNKIVSSLPRNLARVAATLKRERQALHAEGTSTENLPWMDRVDELINEIN
jgi:precorrin-2 dehydrogenase / sirohydrochlorin ferrochelatase